MAPGSVEIQSRNELTWRLNSPLLSPGFTHSVILLPADYNFCGQRGYFGHLGRGTVWASRQHYDTVWTTHELLTILTWVFRNLGTGGRAVTALESTFEGRTIVLEVVKLFVCSILADGFDIR